ncbi:actin maturation protease [Eurosta solidaginis]|uniref:actin maturation protease n=1 Tax=Eurosta solidaginis TaxID=178769 RepID=UPI003530899D
MSNVLPVTPPPPAYQQQPQSANNTKNKLQKTPTSQQLPSCTWALEYPELQKACFLARVCEERPPLQYQLHKIDVILQYGPTCGLVALSMLLGGTPSTNELLHIAKERLYTNNGEMFSAQNLFELTCDTLKSIEVIGEENETTNASLTDETSAKKCRHALALAAECELHQGPLDCAKVRAALKAGACIFIAYDPDYNHSPCLKHGHKAHWALIIGYLISDKNEFFVLARHGKAKNLAVWSLSALSDSNANLVEFEQPTNHPNCDFLLPPGGIGGDLGLRERAIIVNKLPQEKLYSFNVMK